MYDNYVELKDMCDMIAETLGKRVLFSVEALFCSTSTNTDTDTDTDPSTNTNTNNIIATDTMTLICSPNPMRSPIKQPPV